MPARSYRINQQCGFPRCRWRPPGAGCRLLARDAAWKPDRETGARERMTADDVFRNAEFAAKVAHLVFEKLAERLDQLHVHVFRQAAYIVMRLDGNAGSTDEGDALNHVRIKCPLCQEIRATYLLRLLVEDFYEETANNLTLLFRIVLPFKFTDEQLTRVAVDQFYVELVAERLDDLFRFALTQQTVIHEDTSELLTDRLMIKTAATDESTPPDNPQITLPSPTCLRTLAISSSRKFAIVQSPVQPAIL